MARQVNTATIDLIKSFEQCRLVAFKPTPSDPWTIGWGRTRGVTEGMTCTQDEADYWLIEDVLEAAGELEGALLVNLNDDQFGALTSFLYNVGPGVPGRKDGLIHLITGGPSHLLIYTNQGNFPSAANEFPKWDRAGGVELAGLKRRRLAERDLFLS